MRTTEDFDRLKEEMEESLGEFEDVVGILSTFIANNEQIVQDVKIIANNFNEVISEAMVAIQRELIKNRVEMAKDITRQTGFSADQAIKLVCGR